MLHNIVQKKRIVCPNDDDDETHTQNFMQPDIRNMRQFFHSSNSGKIRGESIRNALLGITNLLPLRKQINISRK